MCNKVIECLEQPHNSIDHPQNLYQAVYLMDTPSTTAPMPGLVRSSTIGSNDETPRVKFLCSFLGSILPRPQDGKLRYVGGETRIVSVPRDISYEELMNRMRELYDGAAVLKYQQPDEDLDALVSVVNDDDVTNMMEEYEKLGSGDGFTRLRIFLFSYSDQDGSSHYVDGDERESERRYVDALNNMNDSPEFRRQQSETPVIGALDEIHLGEQFYNQMSLEGSLHGQRNCEMLMPQYNLHNLKIPQMGSGQHQQHPTQRYNEVEGTWSPAYYSPRHHGPHDPRSLPDYPSSPSSGLYRLPFADITDNHHPTYDHQPQFPENAVWMPPGTVSGEKAGFPGNLFHTHGVFEGNSVCEHCRLHFQRNQLHLERPNLGNGLPHVGNQCAECPSHRETFMLNYPGPGRLTDHYAIDGPSVNYPHGHGNLADGHHMPSNYGHVGNEAFHEQALSAVPHSHIPPPEERGARFGNFTYAYGTDNLYPGSHGHVHAQTLWRNAQNLLHGSPSYEASGIVSQVNGSINPSFVRGAVEGSPRFGIGVDNQHPWVDSSQKMLGLDREAIPEYSYGHTLQLNHGQEMQHSLTPELVQPPRDMLNFIPPTGPVQLSDSSSALSHDKLVSSTTSGHDPEVGDNIDVQTVRMVDKSTFGAEKEAMNVEKSENSDMWTISCPVQNRTADENFEMVSHESINSNCLGPTEESGDGVKLGEKGYCGAVDDSKLPVSRMSFLPELIASVKRAALEETGEVKARVEESADSMKHDSAAKEAVVNEADTGNAQGEPELDSDNDNQNTSKIEPTKAEAEAIARGLQTIKNDDLEEIRELGSGTYGAVYHGKWKGSDVAVKRIKASCFAGRPAERERLIADFWKEALILSSLHHPNVVSFYGIVRDGPDGSLATVTEFMVNGSLKQFLQKKDRTIDRRKRLIIAMDAAFGMEYLHGRNIVHFDLKCENLLVNMRDPQRPVCKIGDLGLSKVKQHTLVSGGVRGTLPWMAPELLSGKTNMVTEKIDVYSFGIVMWELLTGEEPYSDMHCASIIGGIVNNTLRPQIPTWCDPEWKSLMESCWASDPTERPSFSEISQKLRSMAAAINVK